MSALEIIQFTTHPGATTEALQHGLGLLDRELERIGGFQDRILHRDAATENRWLLDYRRETLTAAQESMGKVATTGAFAQVMALVADPQSMSVSYGTSV